MEELFEMFPDRAAFDAYWQENYIPLSYADVQKAYEDFVKEADKHIFRAEYEEKEGIRRETFLSNLNQTAEFSFQDLLTEAFYDKNPELYETAFALYEAAEMTEGADRSIAATFHEEYHRLYQEFLLMMYDRMFA